MGRLYSYYLPQNSVGLSICPPIQQTVQQTEILKNLDQVSSFSYFLVTQLTWSHSPFLTLRTRIHRSRSVFMFLRITCVLFYIIGWVRGTTLNSVENTCMYGSETFLERRKGSVLIGVKYGSGLQLHYQQVGLPREISFLLWGLNVPPLLSESTEFPRPSLLWYFWILP